MTPLKRVVLFGRTGEGKSTIANVLVTGGIEDVQFESSDSARGCTTDIKTLTGRGWKVTDTLGVGEATDVGAVSTEDAKAKLTEFLQNVKDNYSHIIYVQKATRRLTQLDEVIWDLFAEIFSGAEQAFVVLFTCESQKWLQDNRDKLPERMKRHEILVTNIPPISKRKALENFQMKTRLESITRLEKQLLEIFMKNDYKYAEPEIATMSRIELEEKTNSIWQVMINKLKSLGEDMMEKVAKQFTTIVDVIGSIKKK